MNPRQHPGQMSRRGWMAGTWSYVLLVVVAAVTIFLVAYAVGRPPPTFPPATPSSPSPTPTPTPTPTVAAETVVFLGDSYTAGTGATDSSARWTTTIAKANGWTEVNLGVAGTGYATGNDDGGLPYIDRLGQVISENPTTVIISGGRFDYSGSAAKADVSAAIAETFVSLRSALPNARIIALGPIWDASDSPARLLDIAREVRVAVESIDGTYVDIGQPLANQPSLIGVDGILPNDAGYVELGSAIAPAVTPIVTDSK